MAFVAAALTITALMLMLVILIGTAQQRVVEALKAGTLHVKRWSGAILLVVGLWLIALAVWADFFAGVLPV